MSVPAAPKEGGLYQKAFGFEYGALCEVMRFAMKSYKFRMIKKRFKRKNVEIAHSDFGAFCQIFDFLVSQFLDIWYGPAPRPESGTAKVDAMEQDPAMRAFYEDIRQRLGIGGDYKFERVIVKNLLVHLLCTATAYNKHLNVALTAEGLFGGSEYLHCPLHKLWALAIVEGDGAELDVSSFAEYVAVVQSQGIRERNFNLQKIWVAVFWGLEPKQKRKLSVQLFAKTQGKLQDLEDDIQRKNRSRRVPYTSCCVSYLQTSACL